MNPPLLEGKKLTKRFALREGLFQRKGSIEAVREVSIWLSPGESIGLVGESGCGKSTLARMLSGLLEPTSGTLLYRGEPVSSFRGKRLLGFRRSLQMIFQDPFSSLNPLMRVGSIVAEPLAIHRLCPKNELKKRTQILLAEVGLDPTWTNRFPASFSGGQRQRVGIARALSLNPEILVCDEPVSSLDLSVQAQILKLLSDLQRKRQLTLLFISHNLNTVSAIADRILIMKEGQIVEEGTNPSLFTAPRHPYTRSLVKLATAAI